LPYLDLTPDFQLYYEIDDHTDAWTKPDTIVMVHGFTENTTACRHGCRILRVITA
jgi:hypothetical protein